MSAIVVACLAGALLGACVGSFLATLARRAPEGWRGMAWGRSRCPTCRHPLAAVELVPLLSWLRQRGRCRHCGGTISPWYPGVEAAAAAIGGLAAALLPPAEAAAAALLGWWLLALATIDLVAWILPDRLTLPLIAAGLLLAFAGEGAGLPAPATPASALAGAALGYLSLAAIAWGYRKLRGREGLGLGDAKLFAAAGAWLGAERLPIVLLTAALIGLAQAALARTRLRADTAVPFGPALAAAFWLAYLLALGA